MSRKKPADQKPVVRNPVAKHAHRFNRSTVFADKTRYSRKIKHKGQDPAPVPVQVAGIGTGSWV
ncbi:MAG: hypothetical protein K0U68_15780 [Gammaproteobacteria bacterium]|nr:hypothetical protein [Gammaproteobacteria bacterium]